MTTPTTFIPGEIGGVEPGDKILINRSGQSYYVDPNELSEKAKDDDLLLVNRGGNSYRCRYADIDDAVDNDLLLINRGGKSYHVTMGELRGVLSESVTFDLRITSPNLGARSQDSWQFPSWSGAEDVRNVTCYGSVLTCTITAKSTDTYAFNWIANTRLWGGNQRSQFNINGDWIAVAGEAGGVVINGSSAYSDNGKYASFPTPGENAPGLNAIGEGLEPQALPGFWNGYWQNWLLTGPQGGSGNPRGNAIESSFYSPKWPRDLPPTGDPQLGPGYSQTRNRAENTGDVWNDITITNVNWELNQNRVTYVENTILWSDEDYSITCNGITRGVSPGVPSNLPEAGVIGDFLTWT